jgi:hypothetical protein
MSLLTRPPKRPRTPAAFDAEQGSVAAASHQAPARRGRARARTHARTPTHEYGTSFFVSLFLVSCLMMTPLRHPSLMPLQRDDDGARPLTPTRAHPRPPVFPSAPLVVRTSRDDLLVIPSTTKAHATGRQAGTPGCSHPCVARLTTRLFVKSAASIRGCGRIRTPPLRSHSPSAPRATHYPVLRTQAHMACLPESPTRTHSHVPSRLPIRPHFAVPAPARTP